MIGGTTETNHTGTTNHSDGHFPVYIRRCSNLTDDQLLTLNLSFSVSAMVSLAIACFVFLMILYRKAYKHTLERLFLYLIIVTGLRHIVDSAAIIHRFKYYGEEPHGLCASLGFMAVYLEYFAGLINITIVIGMLHMVYITLTKKSRHQLKQPRFKHCGYSQTICLEGTLFLFIAIFPFFYTWYPFLKGGYGFGIYTCWVKLYNDDENCGNSSGRETQITLISIYLVNDIIIIVVALVLAFMCAFLYKKIRNPQVTALIRKTLLLVVFVFINGLFIFLIALDRFLHSFGFRVFAAISIIPFSSLPIPIGYLIYLFANNSNRGCLSWFKHSTKQRDSERSRLVHSNNATTPPSTRVSPASYTEALSPVYTGIGITTDAIDKSLNRDLYFE